MNDPVVRLAVDFMEDPAGMIRVVCVDLDLHRSLDQAEDVLRMDICAGGKGDREHCGGQKRGFRRPNFHQLVRCTAGTPAVGARGCR